MSDEGHYILETYNQEKTYHHQKKFDCGNKTINHYVRSGLKKQVKENLTRGVALLDLDYSEKFIGFYTLTSFCIEASLLESMSKSNLPSRIPCSRMVMLGVDKHYQKQGLGKKLLLSAIENTLFASERIGVLGLYLDADPPAVDFYLAHNFVALKERQDSNSTPMFLHIETAMSAME